MSRSARSSSRRGGMTRSYEGARIEVLTFRRSRRTFAELPLHFLPTNARASRAPGKEGRCMLLALWSPKGGSGTSVLAAAAALVLARGPAGGCQLADLDGDQPAIFGFA